MKSVLKVRKKGVIILPKRLREMAGIREGGEVLVEVGDGIIILRPLKPKVVDVDPKIIEELLREEHALEGRKHGRISKS